MIGFFHASAGLLGPSSRAVWRKPYGGRALRGLGRWDQKSTGLYSLPGERFPQGRGESIVHDEQTVAEMANEVLMRQAEARADRSGEPIEQAMEASSAPRPASN